MRLIPSFGPQVLPDFRNVGVMMRILVVVLSTEMLVAAIKAPTWRGMVQQLIEIAAYAQPIVICSFIILAAASNLLRKIPYTAGVVLIFVLELLIATLVYRFVQSLVEETGEDLMRILILVALLTASLLAYFNLRDRSLSPALTEARLQALQARIRPHFLFNSMNAVLSLIRADPQRAELALEDLAGLFRVMLADSRQLSSLANEIALCRQYLNLEQLRLGDRLRVEWRLDEMPADALIPPLILQPLIENAVYHGIEPRADPGTVEINVYRKNRQLHAWLRNPFKENGEHHHGSRMAIANIRERLNLHFDAEASLATRVVDGCYEVHIVIPYLAASAKAERGSEETTPQQ